MFKRIICLCLCVLTVACSFSCAPGKKKTFEKEAKEYFASFAADQLVGKPQNTIKYGKNGSFAYSYPKTGLKDLDAELSTFCEAITDQFLQKSASFEDRLIIGYRAYNPAENIFGVEMHCKTTLAGETVETVECFNRGVDLSSSLKKLVTIEARDTCGDIEQQDLVTYLVTKDGIRVTYKTEASNVTADVPYTKLYAFLPDTLKSILPQTNIRTIDPSKKMVALTFDDGPHNTYTNKILDTLEKYNSVATFFEVGTLVEQGAETIKRAKNMGCEIASHTWSHGNLQKLPLDEIKSQIEKADEAIAAVIGEKPKLLRPPYGAVGKQLRENTDKSLIGWSIDTNDWQHRNKDTIVKSVKEADDLDGEVVLMHSLYDSTAKAVEELVPWLTENGYQLVTVSELVKYRYEDKLESGKYYAYNYFDYEKDND